MSDARWFEIDEDVRAAVTHFRGAVELFRKGGFERQDLDGYAARMAFLHAMQSGHTLMESAFLRVLALMGEERPQGEDWHADLIRRVARALPDRPAIIGEDVAGAADETCRFRHVATRSYDTFSPARAHPAARAAARLAKMLPGAIATFRATIDPQVSVSSSTANRRRGEDPPRPSAPGETN